MTSLPLPSARLFQGRTSSASWRIRIALALKQIAYEPVWVDLHSGEQLGEAYAKIAATRQVPCLEIDGQRFSQSVAILEYLEETRPAPQLLPAGALARSTVRTLVEIVNSAIQPMHNLAVRKRLNEQFGADEASADDWCAYWMRRRFEDLDRLLETTHGKYAFGDTVTFADVFLYPQAMTSSRFGIDMTAYPAIWEIAQNLGALPSFRLSHPPEG